MTKQKEMAKIAYNALDEKKGEDIKLLIYQRFPLWQIILWSQAVQARHRYRLL